MDCIYWLISCSLLVLKLTNWRLVNWGLAVPVNRSVCELLIWSDLIDFADCLCNEWSQNKARIQFWLLDLFCGISKIESVLLIKGPLCKILQQTVLRMLIVMLLRQNSTGKSSRERSGRAQNSTWEYLLTWATGHSQILCVGFWEMCHSPAKVRRR